MVTPYSGCLPSFVCIKNPMRLSAFHYSSNDSEEVWVLHALKYKERSRRRLRWTNLLTTTIYNRLGLLHKCRKNRGFSASGVCEWMSHQPLNFRLLLLRYSLTHRHSIHSVTSGRGSHPRFLRQYWWWIESRWHIWCQWKLGMKCEKLERQINLFINSDAVLNRDPLWSIQGKEHYLKAAIVGGINPTGKIWQWTVFLVIMGTSESIF